MFVKRPLATTLSVVGVSSLLYLVLGVPAGCRALEGRESCLRSRFIQSMQTRVGWSLAQSTGAAFWEGLRWAEKTFPPQTVIVWSGKSREGGREGGRLESKRTRARWAYLNNEHVEDEALGNFFPVSRVLMLIIEETRQQRDGGLLLKRGERIKLKKVNQRESF